MLFLRFVPSSICARMLLLLFAPGSICARMLLLRFVPSSICARMLLLLFVPSSICARKLFLLFVPSSICACMLLPSTASGSVRAQMLLSFTSQAHPHFMTRQSHHAMDETLRRFPVKMQEYHRNVGERLVMWQKGAIFAASKRTKEFLLTTLKDTVGFCVS